MARYRNVTSNTVEILTSRSVERATKKALAAAKKAGVEVLPFPIVGQPYAIQLTDTGGKKLTSADFVGNVVVIDCWATWCTPCVAKLPVLKEIHSRHADDGLQIIGINYDQTTQAMQAVNEKLEIDWSTVYVPSDETTRDLWHASNGIMSLPRILVVDNKGVLRANFENLDEQRLENLVVRLLD
jgi:thiol-disulfide isomerase/thioredoxin